jgi:hypothetical protein
VRAIVQAAERSAAEIEQQATDEAARRRSDAASDAEATRASAESAAQDHVSAVQGETRSMLERIEAVESLLAHLKTTAQEIQTGLDALHDQVGTLGGGSAPEAALPAAPPAESPADPPPAAIAAASIPPTEQAAPAEDAPSVAPETVAEAPTAGAPVEHAHTWGTPAEPPMEAAAPPAEAQGSRSDDEAGARMVALNLMLDGVPRDQIERHLDEHYALADRDGLLDDLYARQSAR